MPNVQNIDKLINFLQTEQAGFDMSDWIFPPRGVIHKERTGAECGTVACIGGSINLLMMIAESGEIDLSDPGSLYMDAQDLNLTGTIKCAHWLGVDGSLAHSLFYGHRSVRLIGQNRERAVQTLTAIRSEEVKTDHELNDFLAAMERQDG